MTYLASTGTITDGEIIGLGSRLSMRPDPSTPNTKFIVDRFIGPSSDGSYNFDVTSLVCNSATIGVGGRLSGISFNTDTVYYVYLLGDSTGTNPDGVGFDVEAILSNYETRGSLGMVNIRERAEAIGGDFKIESAAGEGTKISIDIPKEEAEKDVRIKQRKLTGVLSTSSGPSPSQEALAS